MLSIDVIGRTRWCILTMLLGKLDKRNPTFAAVRILQFCLLLALLFSLMALLQTELYRLPLESGDEVALAPTRSKAVACPLK